MHDIRRLAFVFCLVNGGICSTRKRYLILALMAYWYGQPIWLWDLVQACHARGHGRADELLVMGFGKLIFCGNSGYDDIFNWSGRYKSMRLVS